MIVGRGEFCIIHNYNLHSIVLLAFPGTDVGSKLQCKAEPVVTGNPQNLFPRREDINWSLWKKDSNIQEE